MRFRVDLKQLWCRQFGSSVTRRCVFVGDRNTTAFGAASSLMSCALLLLLAASLARDMERHRRERSESCHMVPETRSEPDDERVTLNRVGFELHGRVRGQRACTNKRRRWTGRGLREVARRKAVLRSTARDGPGYEGQGLTQCTATCDVRSRLYVDRAFDRHLRWTKQDAILQPGQPPARGEGSNPRARTD